MTAAPQDDLPDVETMVNRFLCWPLPKTFMPDCGISFKQVSPHSWPVGTNLFTYIEAKQMVEHMLGIGGERERLQREALARPDDPRADIPVGATPKDDLPPFPEPERISESGIYLWHSPLMVEFARAARAPLQTLLADATAEIARADYSIRRAVERAERAEADGLAMRKAFAEAGATFDADYIRRLMRAEAELASERSAMIENVKIARERAEKAEEQIKRMALQRVTESDEFRELSANLAAAEALLKEARLHVPLNYGFNAELLERIDAFLKEQK